MASRDDLFELIKSLEPNEKRYFKLHAAQHQDGKYKSNYEKLFDALNNWPDEELDEKLFKQKNKGKVFLKNLPVEKNQLYALIMRTMRSYHLERTAESKLTEMIAQIRFLYDKGLHEAGKKIVEKAFILAREAEDLPSLMTLYLFYFRLGRMVSSAEEIEMAEVLFAEEKETIKRLEVERACAHIRKRAFNLYTSGELKKQLNEIKPEILKCAEAVNKAHHVTFATRSYLLQVQALVAQNELKYQDAMKYYEELMEHWENSKVKLHEPTIFIRILLGNYLSCAHFCERYDVFMPVIQRIEDLPVISQLEEADKFLTAKFYKLAWYLNTPDKNGSELLMKEIEAGLKKHAKLISESKLVYFQMNICVLHLQLKQYNKLKALIDSIYNIIGRNKAYLIFARDLKFYEIIVHISQENYDPLDYQLRNTERWLNDNKLNNSFTSVLLKGFKTSIKSAERKKISGQIAEATCPPDLESMKELVIQWLAGL